MLIEQDITVLCTRNVYKEKWSGQGHHKEQLQSQQCQPRLWTGSLELCSPLSGCQISLCRIWLIATNANVSKSFPLNCILLCKSGTRSYCHALNSIVLIGPISYSFCLTNAAWQSLMGFSDAHHGFLSDHFFSPNTWVCSFTNLLLHLSAT